MCHMVDGFSIGEPQRRGRMSIFLTIDEARALHALAQKERREAREQAAFLLRQKLVELGALPVDEPGRGVGE